jgi:hypothetical protein
VLQIPKTQWQFRSLSLNLITATPHHQYITYEDESLSNLKKTEGIITPLDTTVVKKE